MAKTQGPTFQPNNRKKAKKSGFRARKNGNILNSRRWKAINKHADIVKRILKKDKKEAKKNEK